MGANVVNTIAEFTAPYIIGDILMQGRAGLKILSNLCTERMCLSEFNIPIVALKWKKASGLEVAKKIIEAQKFAELDQYRATTHNKGIMNGIDAVALACGQDWRAIESAAHSYAALGGKYKPLTNYEIRGDMFYGRIEMPISVGS
jgi:degradative hydroxymethylglutaryl-CoA reductase